MKSDAYIIVTFAFHKEGNKWVGYCRELGTSTFGRSIQETSKRLNEVVLLHLNTLEEVGERKRFFKENNIILCHTKPIRKEIRIPFDPDTFIRPYIYPIQEELLRA